MGPNVTVTVTFGEAVRNINNSAITNSNAHAVVELKKDNTGSDLAVTGRVTILGQVITIDPASALITGSYTVRVLANLVEDHHDNPLGTAQTATFTVDAAAPSVTFSPVGTVGPDVTVTVTFGEAVRNINNNSVTDSNAHAVVELKKDNTGSDLAVTGRVTILGR